MHIFRIFGTRTSCEEASSSVDKLFQQSLLSAQCDQVKFQFQSKPKIIRNEISLPNSPPSRLSILPTDLAYFYFRQPFDQKCLKPFCPVIVRLNRIFR